MNSSQVHTEREKIPPEREMVMTIEGNGRSRYTISGAVGEMLMWELYPGIRFSYNRFDTKEELPSGDEGPGMLEMNYCISGSHECAFRDKSSAVLKKNDFCISTDEGALEKACFPGGSYYGLGIFVDKDIAGPFLKEGIPGISIDIGWIAEKLCAESSVFYQRSSREIGRILAPVSSRMEKLRKGWYEDSGTESLLRIKLLELLYYLQSERLLNHKSRQIYYPSKVVQAAKSVHRQIGEQYWMRVPVHHLAETHDVSETALKNCFRELYGSPIYTYQRGIRMEKAAEMLKNETYPIALIAEWVGYENAGKFTEAFRNVVGCTPREYRRNAF
ncbi:MAG: helix-turn-helix transcriptional regulator [Blautia sp.]|nr:helix-turn-helix transcriptional regulator [Blautia sp.]